MDTPRYLWARRDSQPPRYELVDSITSSVAAILTFDEIEQKWRWKRSTTLLIHGAPPAEGSVATSLQYAKRKVMEGLPDSP